MSGWSLVRWTREVKVERAADVRTVEVIREGAEARTSPVVTLVTPGGYRIEGLHGLDVGSVLETLR